MVSPEFNLSPEFSPQEELSMVSPEFSPGIQPEFSGVPEFRWFRRRLLVTLPFDSFSLANVHRIVG